MVDCSAGAKVRSDLVQSLFSFKIGGKERKTSERDCDYDVRVGSEQAWTRIQ